MADMNFDKGTTRLLPTTDGEVLAESDGFVVVARVDTQDQARAVKAAVRALGAGFEQVNYDVLLHAV